MDPVVNADGSQAAAGAPDGGAGQQDGGNQAPGWIAQLPDDLKGNETFTGYKTIGELAKAHLDTSGKVAELEGKVANSIPKLTENATDEEKAAYFAALGVPESPDKYELERPAMPEGMPYNEDLEKWFRNTAHKAGITAEQAKTLFTSYNQFGTEFLKSIAEQRKTTLETGMNALKESWGNHYDDNVAVVKRVQEKIGAGSEPMKEWLTAHNAENDPVLIQFLLDVAPGYLDDYAPAGKPPGDHTKGGGMTYPSMQKT